MRVYSLNELMVLTRAQLFELHRQIVTELATLPEGSEEYQDALINLRNIRRALARHEYVPASGHGPHP